MIVFYRNSGEIDAHWPDQSQPRRQNAKARFVIELAMIDGSTLFGNRSGKEKNPPRP